MFFFPCFSLKNYTKIGPVMYNFLVLLGQLDHCSPNAVYMYFCMGDHIISVCSFQKVDGNFIMAQDRKPVTVCVKSVPLYDFKLA